MNRASVAIQSPAPPPQVLAWYRVAGLIVAGLFMAWMTWHFVESLRPARVERSPDDPDERPQYQVLDFSQEWVSARNLLNGKGIYGDHQEGFRQYLELENATPPRGIRAALDPNIHSSLQVNAHPPTAVVLAVPFAWMDYPSAFLAWNLVSLTLFVFAVGLVVRQLGLRVTFLGALAAYGLLLLCDPFRQQVNQGQLNYVLLALIAGAWAAERTGRRGLAGVLLGLATAIKLFPGFLLVYYAVRGRWRVVLSGVASLAACTALTVLLVGFDAYRAYYQDVMPQLERYRDAWINASLPGLFTKLFAAPTDHTVPLVRSSALYVGAVVLSVLVLGAVLLATVRRSHGPGEHDLTFGLAVVVMLLISPITWNHSFLLLLVPLALLWVRLRRLGHWLWLLLASLIALCVQAQLVHRLGGVTTGYFLQPATSLQVLGVLSWQCYALLGLFVVLLAALQRERTGRFNTRKPSGTGESRSMVPPSPPDPLQAISVRADTPA